MCTKCQMFKWISCNFCHRTIIIFITVGTKFIPAVKCLKLTSCNFLSQCKLYFHNFEDCYKVILTTQLMQERYDNTFATFGTYYLLPWPHKHFKSRGTEISVNADLITVETYVQQGETI